MATAPQTRWMSPPPVYDASRSTPVSYTTLTPYLQLSHILSLTWLAYPIISLLFVAFRLQISSASAQDAVANAKGDLLTSCKAAETAATSAASMPRYLAVASNQQITDAVNGSLNAARATLVLALTIMEAIINFIIDIYRSTFLCFLELVVRGGLSIIIGAVQEFNSFIQNAFSSLRTSIQNDIATANKVIQGAVDAINKVNPFSDIKAPQINIPSLDSLQNVTLPSDFQDALLKLNNSLPSVSELKDKVESIIDKPFELLKKDINDTFANITFDSSTLPVPQQNNVLFCDQMDTSVVDDLGHDLLKISKIGTILLVLIALILLAGHCALEWYKWRCLKQHLQYTREAWMTDPGLFHGGSKEAPTLVMSDHNLLMLQASSSHPLLTKIANRISRIFRLSPSQYVHLQWFFHYVFHPPALAVFLIGFFGLLSVQIQLLAISPIAHKYSERAVASANDFSNTIATSMNASMYNQSAAYAADVNSRVDAIQSTVNDGLFGWVNGTTTTLNDTINEFYNDIQNAVNTVFNGTILDEPVQDFIRCFIGSKVDAIESALTFLHDNLHIDVPRVNDSVLVLSPADVNEVTRPVALAAIGSGDGSDNDGLVGRLVAAYVSSLKKERIMFGIFMGLWGLVVLIALCIIFWHSYGRDWVEAYKKRKWQKEQRDGINGLVVPYRDPSAAHQQHAGGFEGDPEKSNPDNLPSFSPMPAPKPSLFSSIRSPTFQAKAPHPLNSRNPTYPDSWDSLLERSNTREPGAETKSGFKISAPKKLMALGKMGRERFVGDNRGSNAESSQADLVEHPTETQQGSSSWLQRLQGAFRRKEPSDVEEDNWEGKEVTTETSERPRPQLTVNTARAEEHARNLPTVEEETPSPQRNVPASAWSVSPGPAPKRPWIPSIVHKRAPSRSSTTITPFPFQPKSRRTASVPSDVQSVRDSFNIAMPQPQPHFAVPLHHGYERPIPPILMSPTDGDSPIYGLHAHNADLTSPALPPIPDNHNHDPFVTPFDDENRPGTVPTPTTASSERKHRSNNPFIAMAI
ncbi:hypothetical protein K474DRAFT_1604961 [Panus rudis PR-1116 ss-1]|nr:hypothetical protein K474DRAFT_1604961 [Panus rudis PR-1116 ss-1]